jgi:1,4-alpha-glucan branching enzyme
VLAWVRLAAAGDPPVVVVCNLTPVPRVGYRLGVPQPGDWSEILNTDGVVYGGSGMGNLGRVSAIGTPSHGFPASVELVLPPLATLYLRLG